MSRRLKILNKKHWGDGGKVKSESGQSVGFVYLNSYKFPSGFLGVGEQLKETPSQDLMGKFFQENLNGLSHSGYYCILIDR